MIAFSRRKRREQVSMQWDQQLSACLLLCDGILFSGVMGNRAIRTTSDRRLPVFKNNSNARRCAFWFSSTSGSTSAAAADARRFRIQTVKTM
jgi:hypothetical protein